MAFKLHPGGIPRTRSYVHWKSGWQDCQKNWALNICSFLYCLSLLAKVLCCQFAVLWGFLLSWTISPKFYLESHLIEWTFWNLIIFGKKQKKTRGMLVFFLQTKLKSAHHFLHFGAFPKSFYADTFFKFSTTFFPSC